MSNSQKQNIYKALNGALLATTLWFLVELYQDFKSVRNDIQQLKQDVTGINKSIEFLKDYELKPKK